MKLAGLWRWMQRGSLRDLAGIGRFQQHAADLRGYIVAKRVYKRQQMRWSKPTMQPFLDVRTAALNDTFEHAFRQRHFGSGRRPANDDRVPAAAATRLSHHLACFRFKMRPQEPWPCRAVFPALGAEAAGAAPRRRR